MRRIVADIIDNKLVLDEDMKKHLRVLRLNKGEEVEILANQKVYMAIVKEPASFLFDILGEVNSTRELNIDLIAFIPLLKNGNFELAIQKAIEVGATKIVPYISSRTIVRLSKKDFEKKKERYDRILKEACLQSNRDKIIEIESLLDFNEVAKYDLDYKYVPYEEESLKGSLLSLDSEYEAGDKVGVIIGPEGGFSKEEINLLVDNGFKAISLGRRILRAETAVIVSLSMIAYLVEVKR